MLHNSSVHADGFFNGKDTSYVAVVSIVDLTHKLVEFYKP